MAMTRRDALKAAGLAVGAAAAAPVRRLAAAAGGGKPNVLLITSEDNGPHLGCYGDKYARTPNLDKLAAGGVRFDRAFVTQAVCSPSRASILTGLYPHQNGQIGLATHKFAMFRNCPNIPSLLKKAGYRTGIIGKLHVNPASAFPFDFKEFTGSNFNKRPVVKFAEQAGKFITASSRPFFLMVNYPDAHFPLLKQSYGVPKSPLAAGDVKTLPFVGVDNKRLRGFTANYYNCLARLDTGVGLLLGKLAAAGKADNTLVIYVGDHGAQFSRGKTTSYESALRVPLIAAFPGRARAGQVRRELVSTVDILPTILAAVGIQAPAGLAGASALGLLEGKTPRWREYLAAEWNFSGVRLYFPQRTIRDGRYKLIVNLLQDRKNPTAPYYWTQEGAFAVAGTNRKEIDTADERVRRAYKTWHDAPPVELYDLEKDPYEYNNLAESADYAAVRKRLADALKAWQRRTADPLADPEKLAKLTAENDRVAGKYKDQGYRRDKKFKWEYLNYLHPDKSSG